MTRERDEKELLLVAQGDDDDSEAVEELRKKLSEAEAACEAMMHQRDEAGLG